MNNATTNEVTCPKCDGAGKIRAFGHIENGKCFLCGATGKLDASKVRKTNAVAVSPEAKAHYLADCKRRYLAHYSKAQAHIPGLTLAEFRELARPHAEESRIEDGYKELNAQCWAAGAFYVVADM